MIDIDLAARELGLLDWNDWDNYFVLGRKWAANSIGFKLYCQFVCADSSLDNYREWRKDGLICGELPKSCFFNAAVVPLQRNTNAKSSHAPRCDTVLLAS